MDEEIERCYEEFYEDVHTEFLKFGEIINFKVCRNGSFHLRGNVYVHYKSLDSSVLAYQSINGRYFAGKQVTCEFVSVTKWKVAICGEFMKSRLKTCSRGTACNFLHCFRNPGGDYEWADWDKPPPKYWIKKMAALFGYAQESGYDNHLEKEGRNSRKMITANSDRYHSRISRSRERYTPRRRYEEYDSRRSRHRVRHVRDSRKSIEVDDKNYGTCDSDSNGDLSNEERGGDRHHSSTRRNTRSRIEVLETQGHYVGNIRRSDSDGHCLNIDRDRERHRGSTWETSSYHKIYGGQDDYEGNKRPHGSDSSGHSSDKDRDTDRQHRLRRRRSHQNKVPVSPDNSRDRIHDGNSWEEGRDRYRRHPRKHSRRSSQGIELGDDDGNFVTKLKDKGYGKESDSENCEPRRVKRQHRSVDHSSVEPSEAAISVEVLKSDRYHESTNSILQVGRSRWDNNDSRYNSNEDGNKMGLPKSREQLLMKHQKCFRDSSSDESSESDSAHWCSRRRKSRDSSYYSDEDVDTRGRWEPHK